MSVTLDNSSNTFLEEKFSENYERLKTLENRLNEELFDQPEAIQCVSEMIKRIVTGTYIENKPLGVFLFAGPTGVGKTETAKIVAKELGIPLHIYDMSEFAHEHKVNRFLGAPQGYIGSDKGGELILTLKKTPFCVVLFDEIEKAHADIYKIFLQLFDEGRLTDSLGNAVSAKKVIFIMTTNLGSQEIFDHLEKDSLPNLFKRLKKLFITHFKVELFNRFEKIVLFNPLKKESLNKIVNKCLVSYSETLAKRDHHLTLTWSHKFIEYMVNLEEDFTLGARSIQRKVHDKVIPLISNGLIQKDFYRSAKIKIILKNNQPVLKILHEGIKPIRYSETESPSKKTKNSVFEYHLSSQPAKNLIGRYVNRTRAHKGDQSYCDEANFISKITNSGCICFKNEYGLSDQVLKVEWNDDQWALVSPNIDGTAFFNNLIFEINDLEKQKSAKKIFEEIFDGIYCSVNLDKTRVFDDLKDRFLNKIWKTDNIQRKIDLIEKLEKILPPFKIVEKNVNSAEKSFSSTYFIPFTT